MAKLQIRCWKTKSFFEIDTDVIPETVYKETLLLGLRELLNRGMTTPNVNHQQQAVDNIDRIYAGKIRFSAPPISNKPQVMKEARQAIKAELIASGQKLSHFKAADITKAAMELIKAETRT